MSKCRIQSVLQSGASEYICGRRYSSHDFGSARRSGALDEGCLIGQANSGEVFSLPALRIIYINNVNAKWSPHRWHARMHIPSCAFPCLLRIMRACTISDGWCAFHNLRGIRLMLWGAVKRLRFDACIWVLMRPSVCALTCTRECSY